MKNLYKIILGMGLLCIDVASSSAGEKDHLYLRNDTTYTLSLAHNIQIKPFHIGVLKSFERSSASLKSNNSHVPDLVSVEATIQPINAPQIKPCYLHFKTYPIFRFNDTTHSTFILVSERNKKLICQPIVFETRGGHFIRPSGAFYELNDAITFQQQILNNKE